MANIELTRHIIAQMIFENKFILTVQKETESQRNVGLLQVIIFIKDAISPGIKQVFTFNPRHEMKQHLPMIIIYSRT